MTTETSSSIFDPAALAQLQGLELRAHRVVEGYVTGVHRSPYHGFSIEFSQHREYTPGDDLRYVDWKAFGRSDKFYLKQFEEETNLICYLLVDGSESMAYQSAGAPMSKLEYARTVAASLACLVLFQQDSVGLVTFDQQLRDLARPSSNPSHLKQLTSLLEQLHPRQRTDTGSVFHDLAERFKRRGIVVILSDLLDNVDSMLAGLRHFSYRRHEVIVMHILDPAELEFPFQQPTLLLGMEDLPDVMTEPKSLRRAYLKELNGYLKRLSAGCRTQQADYVLMRTDQSLDLALTSYLAARKHRRH